MPSLSLDHLAVRRFHRQPGAIGEDLFDLEEVVEAMVAELAAHATLLVAAPDPLHRLRVVVPDPHGAGTDAARSEEHTSELQSHLNLVCRLLLEKKKKK